MADASTVTAATYAPVWASAVTVTGMLLTTYITLRFQTRNLKATMANDLQKLELQHQSNLIAAMTDKRLDRLHNILAELVVAAEGEANSEHNHGRIASLVVSAQLLIKWEDAAEGKLNNALNHLAFASSSLRNAIKQNNREAIRDCAFLLQGAQADLINTARIVFVRNT